MSAFVQHHDHIDLLVTALVRYEVQPFVTDKAVANHWRRIVLTDLDEVGRTLLRENVKSVLCRYDPEAEEQADYAAEIASYTYRATPDPQPPAVALIKACDGYAYQSCEHEGWEVSDAKALVDALRDQLIGHLPGYAIADTWSYERPGSAKPKSSPRPESEPEPDVAPEPEESPEPIA